MSEQRLRLWYEQPRVESGGIGSSCRVLVSHAEAVDKVKLHPRDLHSLLFPSQVSISPPGSSHRETVNGISRETPSRVRVKCLLL